MIYRYINSKLKNKTEITQLQKPDGTMTTSDMQGPEELNNFFKTTFTLEDERNISTISTRISDTWSEISISEELIFSKLLSLNGRKAPGTDALHPHFLKSSACTLAKPLYLFN